MNLNVRKRGGGVEPWSMDKVINSVGVAGLTVRESEALGILIEEWVKKVAVNGEISSIQVRDKVLELLRVIDTVAAEAFEAYKK